MPIDLPKVDATNLDKKPLVVVVTIDAGGQIFVDGIAIEKAALATYFSNIVSAGKQPEMHLRADRATRYDKVTEVLAGAQSTGIVKIAFVTEPAR